MTSIRKAKKRFKKMPSGLIMFCSKSLTDEKARELILEMYKQAPKALLEFSETPQPFYTYIKNGKIKVPKNSFKL